LLPEDLRDPAMFLRLTGWRPGEMTSLERSDVFLEDQEPRIELRRENSKNGQPRIFPLNDPELYAVIVRAWARRRLDCPFVFHRDGKPITRYMFRRSWPKACEKAGHQGLLVYDLRRSAVREFARHGKTRQAMMLTGHKTESVFHRYNIITMSDLQEVVKQRRADLDAEPSKRKVVPIMEAASPDGQLGLKLGGKSEQQVGEKN
jgi:integrase